VATFCDGLPAPSAWSALDFVGAGVVFVAIPFFRQTEMNDMVPETSLQFGNQGHARGQRLPLALHTTLLHQVPRTAAHNNSRTLPVFYVIDVHPFILLCTYWD
jgi:hypothetical protein